MYRLSKKIGSIVMMLSMVYIASAQLIPASRRADWTSAGRQSALPSASLWKDIMAFGGNKTGTADNTAAINNAIASLSGATGVVYFPAGTYLFNSSINVPSNVIIKGASSDSTVFNFNLGGSVVNSFNVTGSASSSSIAVTSSVTKGTTSLTLANASGINAGDYIEFRVDGGGFMTSSWAMDDLAQICKVSAVAGNTITIAKPLRWHFNLSTNPRVYTMSPVQNVGFECFKITRLDTAVDQTTLLSFTRAANCWVKGVEGYKTIFSHVQFSKSIHCEVTESYFHHAWDYGGNGRGYGVCLQSSTSECLVQNTIFEHLRHSMLLQSGANGNVLAYNFSTDPYWVNTTTPINSAGEITLHGNFPFANLMEGNIVDNIVIDNSHGANGPFNTVFRNRAANWGIFMNSGAGDSTNIVNNEMSKTSNTYLFIPISTYILTGNGNYTYGNNQNNATQPAGTASPPDGASYYLASTPTWFTTGSLPNIGYSSALNSGNIPAKQRFNAATTGRCACPLRVAPALACTFVAFYELQTVYACCMKSPSYTLLLKPATGTAPFSFTIDGTPYSASAPMQILSAPLAAPYSRTATISGTDNAGCTFNQSIDLP